LNDTLSRVSEKLGFLLNLEELLIIYTKCAFETAWNGGKSSAWCAPFERDDLQVLAYREDLEYFWKDGYGHEINYEQACTPVKDLLDFFSNETETKVRALFSHSGANLKILARLGLFQDKDPLRSEDFLEVKETYKWKTSLIDTMATNLAFVLYQ
jgi:multiple inositol-polyphosphate phosphatase/2,3-bisphosphoglycerate 3-phosphatase